MATTKVCPTWVFLFWFFVFFFVSLCWKPKSRFFFLTIWFPFFLSLFYLLRLCFFFFLVLLIFFSCTNAVTSVNEVTSSAVSICLFPGCTRSYLSKFSLTEHQRLRKHHPVEPEASWEKKQKQWNRETKKNKSKRKKAKREAKKSNQGKEKAKRKIKKRTAQTDKQNGKNLRKETRRNTSLSSINSKK